MRRKTITYPTTEERLTLGSSDRPPEIGTFTPQAEYNAAGTAGFGIERAMGILAPPVKVKRKAK